MAKTDLLPGVSEGGCPPVAVIESRRAIRRARRRAALRDAAQLIFLFAVDWLFIHWPSAHVPSMDRAHSILVVALLNVAIITHVILSRAFPRWSARRIASTWGFAERARFFTHH
jgi:hypothetical protein